MIGAPISRGLMLGIVAGFAAVGAAVVSSNSSDATSVTPRPPFPGTRTSSYGSVPRNPSTAYYTTPEKFYMTITESINSSTSSFTTTRIFPEFLPDKPNDSSSTTSTESEIQIMPHESSMSDPFPSTSYGIAGASTMTTKATSAPMSSVPASSQSTQTEIPTSVGSVGPIATSTDHLMGDCSPDGALNCVTPDGNFFQHCANGKWTIGYLVEDGTMCIGNATLFAIIPRP